MSFSNTGDDFECEFARLLKEHEHALRVLAFRVTKCEQIAKDIVQDVFLKLWEHRDRYQTIDNIGAWLYRVTENKLIDYLRKTAADKKLRQKTWNRIQEISNETELNIAAKESEKILSRGIDHLPAQRKLIYRMNREQLLNYDEIARELHISRHTVKNQICNALHSLRDLFKNFHFF
ncbi:MAG TPA: RNA polymerase sigma-70 factor [Puia sp.]|jgi:RNA polymerase sigma-70 factor (ECF subfamily)